MPHVKENCTVLKNGKLMPLFGLGCWQSEPGEVTRAVEVALENGYRLIDTAYNYQNEAEVGQGIHNWINKDPEKNKREDIFIVTKLPMIGMSPEGVRKFLTKSLKSFNLSYVDMYLIHTPVGFNMGKDDKDCFPIKNGKLDTDESTDLISIWKEMEKMVDEGRTKSIGVSNFSIQQLRKIDAISRISCVNQQIELHANFQQKEMVQFCRERNIVITAYAPLGSPDRSKFASVKLDAYVPFLLDNPIVTLVAERHKVTTAQILIKFLVQEGFVTIPKSVTPARIKTNGDIYNFKLNDTEMDAIRLLDKGEDGRSFRFNSFPGMQDHPECPH